MILFITQLRMPYTKFGERLTEKGEPMRDNIMYYPAIVLMVVEAAALVFLIAEWFKAKRRNDDDEGT